MLLSLLSVGGDKLVRVGCDSLGQLLNSDVNRLVAIYCILKIVDMFFIVV